MNVPHLSRPYLRNLRASGKLFHGQQRQVDTHRPIFGNRIRYDTAEVCDVFQ